MLDRVPHTAGTEARLGESHGPALLPLSVRGLHYTIDGCKLIDGIDLNLSGGSLTVVMGPNGAGKSVLLRLLHGLVTPTSGRIAWGRVTDLETARLHQAMVFQRPVLLRRSVSDNLGFALKLRGRDSRERRMQSLVRVGLAERCDQPARLLSGGEQQRLALARALVMQPEVLFLDEATSNLDPASVLMIEEIVREAHVNGTKIVFVTHDLGQARRLADDVVFLHTGRVCEHTPAQAFFAQPQTPAAQAFLAGRIVL